MTSRLHLQLAGLLAAAACARAAVVRNDEAVYEETFPGVVFGQPPAEDGLSPAVFAVDIRGYDRFALEVTVSPAVNASALSSLMYIYDYGGTQARRSTFTLEAVGGRETNDWWRVGVQMGGEDLAPYPVRLPPERNSTVTLLRLASGRMAVAVDGRLHGTAHRREGGGYREWVNPTKDSQPHVGGAGSTRLYGRLHRLRVSRLAADVAEYDAGNAAALAFRHPEKLAGAERIDLLRVGSGVAYSADGGTAAVVSSSLPDADLSSAVWVFRRRPGAGPAAAGAAAWEQAAVVDTPTLFPGDLEAGHPVAVSADGRLVAVGEGSTYVILLEPAGDGDTPGWAVTRQVSAPDGLDAFGTSVALDDAGTLLLVGAPAAAAGGGAVAAYTRGAAGGEWTLADGAVPRPDGTTLFGRRLSLSADGGVLLVSSATLGAAHVFAAEGGGRFRLEAALRPPELERPDPATDNFGLAAALSADGRTATLSAPGRGLGGRLYVFSRGDGAAATWDLAHEALGCDAASPEAGFDRSLSALALSGDGGTVLVGSPRLEAACLLRRRGGPGASFGLRNGTLSAYDVSEVPPLGGTFARAAALRRDGQAMLLADLTNGLQGTNGGAVLEVLAACRPGYGGEDFSCERCDRAGQYAPAAGTPACEPCPAGGYCPTSTSRVECPRGMFGASSAEHDASACVPCPPGRVCPGGPGGAGTVVPGSCTEWEFIASPAEPCRSRCFCAPGALVIAEAVLVAAAVAASLAHARVPLAVAARVGLAALDLLTDLAYVQLQDFRSSGLQYASLVLVLVQVAPFALLFRPSRAFLGTVALWTYRRAGFVPLPPRGERFRRVAKGKNAGAVLALVLLNALWTAAFWLGLLLANAVLAVLHFVVWPALVLSLGLACGSVALATKSLALPRVAAPALAVWQLADGLDGPAAAWAAARAASDAAPAGVVLRDFNAMAVYELACETLPMIVVQVLNNGSSRWSPVAVLAMTLSLFVVASALWTFAFHVRGGHSCLDVPTLGARKAVLADGTAPSLLPGGRGGARKGPAATSSTSTLHAGGAARSTRTGSVLEDEVRREALAAGDPQQV